MISQSYTVTTPTQSVFAFTFPFISAAHLVVKVQGVSTTAWTLSASQEFTLDTAAVEDDIVTISRHTPTDAPMVNFVSPSTLRAREIQLANDQVLYAIQEQDFVVADVLAKSTGGSYWVGEGLALRDIAAPVEPEDAATKAYVDASITSEGNLPAHDAVGDIGKGLIINEYGYPDWQGISKGSVTFQVPFGRSAEFGNNQAYYAPAAVGGTLEGSAWATQAANRVPLELLSSGGVFSSGVSPTLIGNEFDLAIARSGVYEITVQGDMRSAPDPANGVALPQIQQGVVALTDSSGNTVFDKRPNIILGVSSSDFAVERSASTGFTLNAIVTVTGSQIFNFRAGSSGPGTVFVSNARMTIKEL